MIKVTAAIIARSGRVFIAKRKASARMPGMWEFPGGKIEAGETPAQCLKRELQEEFEIEAAIGDFIGTSVHHYDFDTVELMAFKTRIAAGEIRLKDHDDMAWVAAGDLNGYDFAPADKPFVEMIRRGEIAI